VRSLLQGWQKLVEKSEFVKRRSPKKQEEERRFLLTSRNILSQKERVLSLRRVDMFPGPRGWWEVRQALGGEGEGNVWDAEFHANLGVAPPPRPLQEGQ